MKKPGPVLGLNYGELNSSAALLLPDGSLLATAEERFNRTKKSKLFPHQSIAFLLSEAGLKIDQMIAIGQHWNPGAYWEKYNPLLSKVRSRREDNLYTVSDNLFRYTNGAISEWTKVECAPENNMPPIYHIHHHRTHAANAFYLSKFDEAAIYTADWRGEFESGISAIGKSNQISILASQKMPHSLGMYYSTWTEFMGYRPDHDEWKVMAISAYNVHDEKLYQKVKSTVQLFEDGSFKLNPALYKGAIQNIGKTYSEDFVELFGSPLSPQNNPDERACATATVMQRVSEEIIWNALRALYKKTKLNQLCVSGGYFMNCVCNGKILEETPFKALYVGHSPSDSGNSIGAASYVLFHILGAQRFSINESSYLGPTFTTQDVKQALKRSGIASTTLEHPTDHIAELMAQGHIVAHFDGQMEFGERALGNRSILGDPRDPKLKDMLNAAIKYREGYRPFAPVVLEEEAPKWFEVKKGYQCKYMEKTVRVRPEYRDQLPAITHVDGSSRVQTVTQEDNPRLYDIIKCFEEKTGIPIILNTSFNVNHEPIVCSPQDALNTFFNSGLRHLVLGNELVQKELTLRDEPIKEVEKNLHRFRATT